MRRSISLSFAALLAFGSLACSSGAAGGDGDGAGDCTANADCAGGSVCAAGTCTALCSGDRDCSGGQICTDTTCIEGSRTTPVIISVDGDSTDICADTPDAHCMVGKLIIAGEFAVGGEINGNSCMSSICFATGS